MSIIAVLGVTACGEDGDATSHDDAPPSRPAPDDPLNRHEPAFELSGSVACESGTYTTSADASICLPWTTCPPGQYVETEPSSTADRVCADCAPGTHSTHDNSPRCAPEGECPAGTYAAGASDSESVSCRDCPEGTWNDATTPEACQAASVCPAGARVVEDVEPTHDRRCDECPAGTFSGAPNAAACTACEPGNYCPEGSSEPESCAVGTWDWDNDPTTECYPWSECDDGFREVAEGTPVTDRECAPGEWYHELGEHGGEGGGRVLVDAAGDLYVAAATLGNIDGQTPGGGVFVRKLSGATGTELWRTATRIDGFSSFALDPAGALLIAETEYESTEYPYYQRERDTVVRKLSTDTGGLLSTIEFGDQFSMPEIAVSADGDIAMAGQLAPGDGVVRKLNAAGNTVWEAPIEGFDPGVAFDSAGNVAVHYSTSYRSEYDDEFDDRAYVSLLSGEDGEQLWTIQVDSSWNTDARAIRSDGTDRLAVLVTDSDPDIFSDESAARLVLLDSGNGAVVWSHEFDDEAGRSICFDAAGDLLVAKHDGTLQALSRQDGSELWATTIARAAEGLTDVAGTPSGNVVLTGADVADRLLTVQLDGSDRSEQWHDSFTTSRNDELYAVAFDGTGDVIVGGSTETAFERETPNLRPDALVRKLSGTTGEPLWTRQFGSDDTDAIYAVQADAFGNVVVGGALGMQSDAGAVGDWDALVSKLSGLDGSTLWSVQMPSATREAVEAIALDSLGDVIVTGYTGRSDDPESYGAYVRKLSAVDGSSIWERPLTDAGRKASTAPSVGVMPNGDAIASWVGETDSGVLRLSSADGSIVWEERRNSSDQGHIEDELAVDGAGDVVLLSSYGLQKLSGADGSELWTAVSLGPHIAIDPTGDVVAVYYVDGEGYELVSRFSGSTGDQSDYAVLNLWNSTVSRTQRALAVSASGEIVLAGSVKPYPGPPFDSDGFVIKLLE